jgi:hypothetical protein
LRPAEVDGEVVLAVSAKGARWLFRLLEQHAWQRHHRGLAPEPIELELLDAAAAVIALDELSVSDSGHAPGPTSVDSSGWLTAARAAELAGVSPRSVSRWAATGEVRSRRIGLRMRLVHAGDIEQQRRRRRG